MHYTFKQIINSLPKSKNSKSSLWVKLIIRKLSFIFTYLFINIGFSAWATSIFSIFIVLLGCVLLSINNSICIIVGVLLIQLWLVFDCVDGNIARVKKTSSLMGEFIDALSGYYISAFVFFAIGITAYHTTNIFYDYNILFIIIGAIASISNILTRLIHQKFVYTNIMISNNKINNMENDVEMHKGFAYIRSRFDKELGLSGLFMPFLIIALIFNLFDFLCIFYFLFSLGGLFLMTLFYSIKSKNLGSKQAKKYKIGYTTGVYDLFHIGHLNIFEKAKEYCDYLIVGITTDDLCYQRKNKMPIIPYNERKKIVESIKYVDKVVIQKNMDKLSSHKDLHYDVVFVGSDWKGTKSWNSYEKMFNEIGVDVIYLQHTDGISSTIIQEKLNNGE